MIYELSFKLVDGMYMPRNVLVERAIETDSSCNLRDLLFALLHSLDFDFDHMYEFRIGNKRFKGSPMGSEGKDLGLDSLELKEGSRFRLIYDFGDDWTFDVVVRDIHDGTVENGIKVTESVGTVEQYPDYDEWDENDDELEYTGALTSEQKQLADEMGSVEILLFNDDEAAAADKMLEIWPKIKDYVLSINKQKGQEGGITIDEADPSFEMDLWNTLMDSDLPFLNQKRYEEGIQLWNDILGTFRWEGNDGDQLKGAIGEALASMGEKEKMTEHFRQWERENPNSVERMNYHLMALGESKDWETARDCLDSYLNAVDDEEMRLLILQRAVEIYEALGDSDKCDYYAQQMSELEEELYGNEDFDEELFFPDIKKNSPIIRSQPKIYPNEPCPCGSGKKYKKCCGRNT